VAPDKRQRRGLVRAPRAADAQGQEWSVDAHVAPSRQPLPPGGADVGPHAPESEPAVKALLETLRNTDIPARADTIAALKQDAPETAVGVLAD